MKFHRISTIIIWSENYLPLAMWYKNTFELSIVEELNHEKDTGILFSFPDGNPWLWVGQHSKIKGKNGDPLRLMFNINVDSVSEAHTYLLNHGAMCVAKPFKAPTMEKYFATYSDPDGNTFQTIGLQ